MQGRYDEAVRTHQRCLAIKELVWGADHPSVATTLNNGAELLKDQVRT